ncbi:MAG: methyltransferase domain-containing protein [Methanomicrobiales archaeon]|nr:methyltransferase domain-containing protein [Methanomicrobiales archaeon]
MKKGIQTFDANVERYDRWFDEHYRIYQSEVSALEQFVPQKGEGLEIGVGTGRFAAPLHIALGIDLSLHMVQRARERGIQVILARGESLPFCAGHFDFILMVTVICFLHEPARVMVECRRVLRRGGVLLLAFIDKESPLGNEYRKDEDMRTFFKDATFYTVTEIRSFLIGAGFTCEEAIPVAFEDYGMIPSGFVIARAIKK